MICQSQLTKTQKHATFRIHYEFHHILIAKTATPRINKHIRYSTWCHYCTVSNQYFARVLTVWDKLATRQLIKMLTGRAPQYVPKVHIGKHTIDDGSRGQKITVSNAIRHINFRTVWFIGHRLSDTHGLCSFTNSRPFKPWHHTFDELRTEVYFVYFHLACL